MNRKEVSCPAEIALKAIAGRWKLLILRELYGGVSRFGKLHRALRGISEKMLTQDLKELDRDGLVSRRIYPQVPLKVEYSLTPSGKALMPILDALHEWSTQYFNEEKTQRAL